MTPFITLRDRLLLLLALDVAACLVVVTASGRFDHGPRDAAIAGVVAVLAVGAARLLRAPAKRDEPSAAPRRDSLVHSKRVLLLLVCVGLVSYVGGNATFAIFSAETTNPNSSMATGTLTMGNQVNSGTTCQSYNGPTNDNVNSTGCDALLALTNMGPGASSKQAKLTITNSGSLDGSKLYVYAPYPSATLGATLSGTVTTLTLATGFWVPLANGDVIQVSYNNKVQNFTVSHVGGYSAGATSVAVTSVVLPVGTTYPAASRVLDTNGNASAIPSSTDCHDAFTASAPVAGATYGNLNFNSPTNNPLCQSLLFWVQEQSASGKNYCWSGLGAATAQCRTPTTATTGAALSGTIGSITVNPALTGNVQSGDTITLSNGTTTNTCTASAAAYIGDASIAVGSCNLGANSYASGSAVKDTSGFAALDADTAGTHTVWSFDTSHSSAAKVELSPVTGNGTINAAATVELNKTGDAGSTRIFYVGAYLPAPSNANQNQIQALLSTFGLTWHVDQ